MTICKAKQMPDIETLHKLFRLDADNGVLIRNRTWTNHKEGEVCGTPMKSGHLQTAVNGRRYLVHRIIYFMHYGVDQLDSVVDHINGNPADNRPDNLRLASKAENSQHKTGTAANNTSGFRGVSWDSTWQRWKVSIVVGGKRIQRKFKDKDAAIAAADQLRQQHYGEFAGVTL